MINLSNIGETHYGEKKTIQTRSWGAVIHTITLPRAGTYLIGANYSPGTLCFIEADGYKYLNPGGTAVITVAGEETIQFASSTSSTVNWTDFSPYYVFLKNS